MGELNAYDILCNDWIVFTPDTLPGDTVVLTEEPAAAAPVVAEAPTVAEKPEEATAAGEPARAEEPVVAEEPAPAGASGGATGRTR